VKPDNNQQLVHKRNSGGSVERTMELLKLLVSSSRAISLAELSEQLELPKTTVHRLCTKLVDLHFLVRELDERYYVVGPALRELAFNTLSHGSLRELRHKVLADLVDKTGETCNFTTLDGASVLYLDRVEAERPWRLTMGVGVHVPLHCTASGKLFLSQMASEERYKRLHSVDLQALTPHTITNIDLLEANLQEISSAGYSTDAEEFILGLIAIAVPVKDNTGKLRAAIAMHCPTTHVDLNQAISKLPALKTAATQMGELLDV